MNHQTSSVPQIAYQSPQVSTQPMTESPLVDLSFAVHVFSPGDDPIACLNKAMAFLTVGRQGQSYSGTGYKSNATSSRETMQVNRQGLLNATTVKDKAMLAEAQEAGKILDEEKLTFIADPGVPDEVPHSKTYFNDMKNQGVHAMQDFEQTPVVDFIDNEIHSDSNIIPYSQYLQETQ
ncbi:hypothetical protein Tco_1371303 [Tanacetum coccineum]